LQSKLAQLSEADFRVRKKALKPALACRAVSPLGLVRFRFWPLGARKNPLAQDPNRREFQHQQFKRGRLELLRMMRVMNIWIAEDTSKMFGVSASSGLTEAKVESIRVTR
jgi:hypothetical protein